MDRVPTIRLSHMSEAERRAYVLADKKLALNAGWAKEMLAIELQGPIDPDFDVELAGFSFAEIDFALDDAANSNRKAREADDDLVALVQGNAVTRTGDIWELGRHRLLCGDAQNGEDFAALMQGECAHMVFTDPPYNVEIDGNVCGLGRVQHREFAFASGEMSETQFTQFLACTLGHAAANLRDGAIALVCMDWRHIGELILASRPSINFDAIDQREAWLTRCGCGCHRSGGRNP
jgi:hypothetical protein